MDTLCPGDGRYRCLAHHQCRMPDTREGETVSALYDCNVIIDLEFTYVPKKRRKGGLTTEIIEVGAVKVDAGGTVAGEFSHMVRPTLAPGVSGNVRRMTGIGSEDVAYARPLGEVLGALGEWMGAGRVRIVTWSDTDRRQIARECAVKGIEPSLPTRWLDIQRIYPRLMGMGKGCVSLGRAADWCGIANDRLSAHRALYDAQVTAEIFLMMASGECASHRARVEAELDGPKEGTVCSSSIGESCGGLAELLATLKAQEATPS